LIKQERFKLKVVNLHIDNGKEYLSSDMREYCAQNNKEGRVRKLNI